MHTIMKLRNILIISLLGFCAAPFAAQAQIALPDKKAQTVDLGYGVEQSEFLTTAATYTITAEELRRTSAISLADALYGKLLGLTALQNTGFKGEEGRGASFNIRGAQTTGETAILILVDGQERPIDRLSVEEVESVTVLRDAAAVALYGHEGVNGVLLVKTKRGVADSGFHIKAGASRKIQFDPQMADMVDAYDYANALNTARMNDGIGAAYSASELQKFQDGSDPYVYPNVNWKNEVFKNTASETNAFVSMYGGSEKVEYYTQLDYTDASGLYKNPDQGDWNSQLRYSKANIRTNVDFQVTSTTKVRTNIFALFMETNGVPSVNSNDAWWHLYKVPALAFPIKTLGGVWGGSQTYGDFNLVAKATGTGFTKTHQRQIWADLTLIQDLDFILPGLQFYAGGAYDNASNTIENRRKGYQYGWNWYDANNVMQETVMGTVEDKLVFNYYVDSQWRVGTLNTGLKYAAEFQSGDHFSANAGYNMKSEVRDGQSNTWYRANWTLATHYDHADWFMWDLVLAANGSNRSYPAKWAFSPTTAIGVIYANNPDGVLNYGKLRVSAGIQHTDYVPANGLWLDRWSNSHGQFWYGTNFASSWGAFLTQFPTSDFRQEAAYKANVGTDLRIANSLDFTVDAFYQQRRNILVSAGSLNSDVVGIQSSYDDKGRVASYGVEAGLRYAKTFAGGFSLFGGANASFVKSQVLEWIETPAYPRRRRARPRLPRLLPEPGGDRVQPAAGVRPGQGRRHQVPGCQQRRRHQRERRGRDGLGPVLPGPQLRLQPGLRVQGLRHERVLPGRRPPDQEPHVCGWCLGRPFRQPEPFPGVLRELLRYRRHRRPVSAPVHDERGQQRPGFHHLVPDRPVAQAARLRGLLPASRLAAEPREDLGRQAVRPGPEPALLR